MEETISIKNLLQTLRKRWILIVITTLIAALASGIISYFVLTPVYQSSTQLLVNQKNSAKQIDVNQLQSNVDMINTYSVIIKSPVILQKVIEELNLSDSVDQLNQKITVSNQENSQVFTVTVEDTSSIQAGKIANTVASIFQNDVPSIMNVDNVSILSKAKVGDHLTPVEPKPLLNIAAATLLGLVIGAGLALLIAYFDNSIKNETDVEEILKVPVIGMIPEMTKMDKNETSNHAVLQRMGSEKFES